MKKVSAVRLVERDEAALLPELSEELRVAFAEIADVAREGLLAMSVSVGLGVMAEMMEAEVTSRAGAKHAKCPEREAGRHGSAPGSVVLGGRRVRVERPRVRSVDGDEVQLESYATFGDDDLLGKVVLERMLAGLATRRHRAANEPVGAAVEAEATSTSRSAVSRRFIAGTSRALEELMSRDLGELDVVVLVVDGAKALAAGVRKVFGDQALVQRCQLHKRRNVADHLPKETQPWVDRKLATAFANPDPDAGLRAAKDLARSLERAHPDAAASVREGLEEMFTVRRLGVGDRLARTLTSTNPIESMISISRTTARNVKRWRDGTMVKRWCAAGMVNAQRSFRRVKGCKDMPVLVAALRRHVEGVTPACKDEEAA